MGGKRRQTTLASFHVGIPFLLALHKLRKPEKRKPPHSIAVFQLYEGVGFRHDRSGRDRLCGFLADAEGSR